MAGEKVADVVAPKKADAVVDTKAPVVEGGKVGEIFESKGKTVPEAPFLELKGENKAIREELNKLQDMIVDGLTKKEVSDTLKKIGEKYKVDPNFLKEVSDAIKAEADADTDRKIDAKTKPPEKKEKEAKASDEDARIDRIFQENFDKTIAAMPDFKDIADRDAVKSLTLDPANRDRTFAQIVEKAYGHLVKSKGKTLDQANAGGGKEPAEINYEKASSDPAYFREIMANPASRKEYNANLHKRLRL